MLTYPAESCCSPPSALSAASPPGRATCSNIRAEAAARWELSPLAAGEVTRALSLDSSLLLSLKCLAGLAARLPAARLGSRPLGGILRDTPTPRSAHNPACRVCRAAPAPPARRARRAQAAARHDVRSHLTRTRRKETSRGPARGSQRPPPAQHAAWLRTGPRARCCLRCAGRRPPARMTFQITLDQILNVANENEIAEY